MTGFGTTTMTLTREMYDGSGEIMEEIEIYIEVSYSEEEKPSWDSPGSAAECEVLGCTDQYGQKTELTLCEEEYVSKSVWEHLKELEADAQMEDYEHHRRSSF